MGYTLLHGRPVVSTSQVSHGLTMRSVSIAALCAVLFACGGDAGMGQNVDSGATGALDGGTAAEADAGLWGGGFVVPKPDAMGQGGVGGSTAQPMGGAGGDTVLAGGAGGTMAQGGVAGQVMSGGAGGEEAPGCHAGPNQELDMRICYSTGESPRYKFRTRVVAGVKHVCVTCDTIRRGTDTVTGSVAECSAVFRESEVPALCVDACGECVVDPQCVSYHESWPKDGPFFMCQ